MNLRDGGKQPVMRSTTFINKDGVEVVQSMKHSSGIQKGLKTVLTERGLWEKAVSGGSKEREEEETRDEGGCTTTRKENKEEACGGQGVENV